MPSAAIAPPTDRARRRDLWWQFTVRTVELRHRGSHLGLIWALLNPLIMLAIYATVFGLFFDAKFRVLPNETPADFVVAMFLGLIIYQLFAETLTVGPGVIVANPNLVKKIVFPLDILPLAQVGAAWFHLTMSMVLLVAGALLLTERGLGIGILWLPVILLPLALLSIGFCWLLSALGVFFRDLTQIMPFIAHIILYASAILYPVKFIHDAPPVLGISLWNVLKWNPLIHTVDLARGATFWERPMDFEKLAYTYACGAIAFLAGRWMFNKLQPAFADVI